MNKTAAVVVTFNRKELLLKNINMLLIQKIALSKIIIIDNASTDGTQEFLSRNLCTQYPIIQYVRLDENIGGAGGFYEGVKIGYESGYDWLWLMDDDGAPSNEYTFEEIIIKADEIKNKGFKKIILNSLVLYNDTDLSFGLPDIFSREDALREAKDGLIANSINAFNGTLLSKELVEAVGFPRKEFFIKGDEAEYVMRCKKSKAFIATVVSSLYTHPPMPMEYVSILGKKVVLSNETPWKEYYRMRNYTYMYIKNRSYKLLYMLIITRIIGAITSKNDKLKKLIMVLKGLFDGITGRLGIRVLP